MPIVSPRVRSLNLSTSVAIAAYEVLRQRRAVGGRPANATGRSGPSVAGGG